ncbi:hypothetical protein C4D60_Mb02t00360 [Musa balbisiana]|uniref:Uncharacterized protein n=1 Tax=Musa balbisiana TaxID=52838 RepID=A0A4S8I773_MUSBA|nr:hypothetical protein C4D60_Mb02t00360 [Musa balbisiana]
MAAAAAAAIDQYTPLLMAALSSATFWSPGCPSGPAGAGGDAFADVDVPALGASAALLSVSGAGAGAGGSAGLNSSIGSSTLSMVYTARGSSSIKVPMMEASEGGAALPRHEGRQVDLRGRSDRGLGGRGGEGGTDLDDGEVVRDLLDGLDEGGSGEGGGGEEYVAGSLIRDVDEAGGVGCCSGGLKQGGGEGGAAGELVELLGAEVVDEDVEGEEVLEGIEGEARVGSEEGRHGGVVDGEDGDGETAVDLACEVGGCKVVVEGGELRVLRQNARDVVPSR